MSRTELAAQARAVAARADSVHPVMLAPAALLALVMITVAALAAVVVLAALVMTAGAAALVLCLDRGLQAAAGWQPRRTKGSTPRTEVPA